jgi:hypothetical protein
MSLVLTPYGIFGSSASEKFPCKPVKDSGGVCLGFFELSTKISWDIETNGLLWALALPKPKHLVGR